jgi:hypothetical protein
VKQFERYPVSAAVNYPFQKRFKAVKSMLSVKQKVVKIREKRTEKYCKHYRFFFQISEKERESQA